MLTRVLLLFVLSCFAAFAAPRCPAGYTLTNGVCVRTNALPPVVAPGVIAPTTAIFGLPLTGASFPSARASAVAAGDTDLYTAPAGKRALIAMVSATNAGSSTAVWFPELKSGGAYYRVGLNAISSSGGISAAVVVGIVLEPGESISVNATGSGFTLNVQVAILQFDSTSPLRTVKLLGPGSGSTTFYTVPPGKTSYPIGNVPFMLNGSGGPWFGAGAVAGGVVDVCIAATGTSATCATGSAIEIGSVSAPAATRTFLAYGSMSMSNQDMLSVFITTGDAAQIVWVNVLEM